MGFLLPTGCGDDTNNGSGKVCNVGDTRACVGPGACDGGQECKADGSGFEPCACGDVTPGGAGNHPDGGSPGAGKGGNGGTAGGGSSSMGGETETPIAGAAGSTDSMAGGGSGGEGGASSPPVEPVCHPIGELGCTDKQNCEILADSTQCVTAGAKAELASCTATSECAHGLLCLRDFGVCAKPCADDNGCGGGVGSCRLIGDYSPLGLGTVGGCLKKCDVLAPVCPGPEQSCHMGSCMHYPSQFVGTGEACQVSSQCGPGLDCLTDLDGDQQADCSFYCDTTAQKNPCAQGQSCYALNQTFPGVPASWGICVAQ